MMTADAGGRRADAAHHVRIGTVSVEEQLERIGWGRFQAITLSAFILIIMADGMELVVRKRVRGRGSESNRAREHASTSA